MTMKTKRIKRIIEQVLDFVPEVKVEEASDHSGDESLFVTLIYPKRTIIDYLGNIRKIRDKLTDAGEHRFPYTKYVFK